MKKTMLILMLLISGYYTCLGMDSFLRGISVAEKYIQEIEENKKKEEEKKEIGEKFLTLVEKGKMVPLVKFMQENKESITKHKLGEGFRNAALYGFTTIVAYLLQLTGEKDIRSNIVWAVAFAAQNGHFDVIDFLCRERRQDALPAMDLALDLAASGNRLDMVAYLLKNFGHVLSDKDIEVACLSGVKEGFLPIVDFLLQQDANIDRVRLLKAAVNKNCANIIDFLIKFDINNQLLLINKFFHDIHVEKGDKIFLLNRYLDEIKSEEKIISFCKMVVKNNNTHLMENLFAHPKIVGLRKKDAEKKEDVKTDTKLLACMVKNNIGNIVPVALTYMCLTQKKMEDFMETSQIFDAPEIVKSLCRWKLGLCAFGLEPRKKDSVFPPEIVNTILQYGPEIKPVFSKKNVVKKENSLENSKGEKETDKKNICKNTVRKKNVSENNVIKKNSSNGWLHIFTEDDETNRFCLLQ